MKKPTILRFPAIEVRQSPGRVLYTFAADGKVLHGFAAVSRIHRRDESGAINGYQRPEVLAHISEIRNYLESESPMIPNAVVLAFDSRVRFEATDGGPSSGYSRSGVLLIPLDETWDDEHKPGFIVDGQQRLAAVRDAEISAFPMCVTAFITDDVRQQAEQFILVNSTKPLPKGLIYELLPSTDARLPTMLHKRRFPAMVLDRLNRDDDSPLKGKIQTATNPEGVVKDNSILKMLENSLSDGALHRFRGVDENDIDGMLQILKAFWSAVSVVFPEAWGQPPKRSRLMHGAGILSLGLVMDAIADRHRSVQAVTPKAFEDDLRALAVYCRWTDGYWDFGPGQQRKWNELQNTSKDIQLLANYLMVRYKAEVWSKAGRQQSLVV
jgi:DGQHR domain-containing protein